MVLKPNSNEYSNVFYLWATGIFLAFGRYCKRDCSSCFRNLKLKEAFFIFSRTGLPTNITVSKESVLFHYRAVRVE
jgi:hypothetical protein